MLALVVDHGFSDCDPKAAGRHNQLDDLRAETLQERLEIRRLVSLPRHGLARIC